MYPQALTYHTSFNPHTHAGCDSISSLEQPLLASFNPHTHAGCDCSIISGVSGYSMFQSTHPRRVWHYPMEFWSVTFVSIHTPTQGVTLLSFSGLLFPLFQSTHPRRVWLGIRIRFRPFLQVSIHTPTQGVTVAIASPPNLNVVSIHTPTQGVTKKIKLYIPVFTFQSTHPRRVWLSLPCVPVQGWPVSIHTPTQGVTE